MPSRAATAVSVSPAATISAQIRARSLDEHTLQGLPAITYSPHYSIVRFVTKYGWIVRNFDRNRGSPLTISSPVIGQRLRPDKPGFFYGVAPPAGSPEITLRFI